MFRLFPDPKAPPSPAKVAAAEAAMRRVESRAALSSRLVALNLTKQDPRLGQVDMHDVARLLVILHVYNPEMRRSLYRRHIDVPEDLEALLASRPDLVAMGTRDAASPRLEAPFWVVFFDFVRLPEWNISQAHERVVVARDRRILESRLRRDELPDTRHFVRFFNGLREALFTQNPGAVPRPRHADAQLAADVLLLYFTACLLTHKNADEVIARPRFDYLDEPRAEATPLVRGLTGRAVALEYMRKFARADHIEDARTSDEDFMERIYPMQMCVAELLAMVDFDFDARYTVCSPADVKRGGGEERRVTMAPDAKQDDAAAEDKETAPSEVPPPPGDDDDDEGDDLSSPPETLARDDEDTPAETIDSEAPCTYHVTLRTHGADGLCPAACVSRRLGAPVAIGAAVFESRLVSDSVDTRTAPSARAATVALVTTALSPEETRARTAILARYGAASRVFRPAATPAEWTRLMGAFEQVGVSISAADALAAYGGWSTAPPRERLARYVTAYGAPAPLTRAWTQQGWSWTPEVERRVRSFRERNPRVPLRTLQEVAHLLSAAAAAADGTK